MRTNETQEVAPILPAPAGCDLGQGGGAPQPAERRRVVSQGVKSPYLKCEDWNIGWIGRLRCYLFGWPRKQQTRGTCKRKI